MKLKDIDDFDITEDFEDYDNEDSGKVDELEQNKIAREQKLAQMREKPARTGAVLKVFFSLFGCLIFLVVLLYGGAILHTRIGQIQGERENSSIGKDTTVISDKMMYSSDELNNQVEKALDSGKLQGREEVLNSIKTALDNGNSVVEILRSLFPENIVVASEGKYHFVPINEELQKHILKQENVQKLDNGEIRYLTDGIVTSHKGIDVSSHQGNIDWQQVAADGVEFAFIRVAFRGYGKEGKLVEDTKFDENIQGAKAAGIKVGVYIFSQAINEDELREEADLVLQKIAPYELDCPVVYDVEMVSGNGRMNALTLEERTNLTLLFCQLMEEAGKKPMIYHNTVMGALKLDLATLEGYDKWYASYSETLFYPYAFKVWQYSDKGRVQGIGTNVDMNIALEPIWK